MEYERIGKVQSGMISPSKLRMKLTGPHHLKKKDGSNCNSTRTSPSKHDDAEFVKNSLLASETNNLLDEVTSSSLEVPPLKLSSDAMLHQNNQTCYGNMDLIKMQHSQNGDNGKSGTIIPPAKTTDDENLECDSSASSSSFEFHKERPVNNPATRFLLRPIPSKWNDAEKWIMNRQNIQAGYTKKNALQNQVNRFTTSMIKVAPDSDYFDNKLPKAKVAETERVHVPVMESFPETKGLKEADDKTAVPGIRSVAMRDMGTEMTPMTSQGPSRTSTPIGSITPVLSPAPSMPSTPRRGANPPSPVENTEKKLSEEELKLKTRKEIEALGVQLGKMNIAAWASHDEKVKKKTSSWDLNKEERGRIEFQKRAASWEQAEKSRYTARYKREDIKIQAWESQQKAKLEAEMRRIEAKVEQMKAQARAKAVKKIAMLRQRTEEKFAAAEARKNREAARIAEKGEYIRQSGRIPSSNYIFCGLL
ncbi:hypothetical protein HN51_057376 [Arachis hypogaea]|uniref:uncharacterized protein n=1 Tax=Arachis hypogaea TaxID=3818 RepID=UPI0007AF1E48|nr:uncharacterized protein LOC107623848 isoform X1 [Arachis ipaensis]XP_025682833.1 uncharacterized protein LOC112783959 [Arachis hypogaea]QHN80765.1 uncharacterized protein DS421_20g680990 [Arachis hypogaea]